MIDSSVITEQHRRLVVPDLPADLEPRRHAHRGDRLHHRVAAAARGALAGFGFVLRAPSPCSAPAPSARRSRHRPGRPLGRSGGARRPPIQTHRCAERARGAGRRGPRAAARHHRDRRQERLDDREPRVQRPLAPLRAHVLQGQQGHPEPGGVPRPGARARHGLERDHQHRAGQLLLHHDDRPLRRRDGVHARRHRLAPLRREGAGARARGRHRRDRPQRGRARSTTSGATSTQRVWWKYPSAQGPARQPRRPCSPPRREKMQTIQERYYVPNNSVLVVTGDVKAKDVFAAGRQALRRLGKGADPFKKYPLVKHPPIPKSEVVLVEQPVQTVSRTDRLARPLDGRHRASSSPTRPISSAPRSTSRRRSSRRRSSTRAPASRAGLVLVHADEHRPDHAELRGHARERRRLREGGPRRAARRCATPGYLTDEEMRNAAAPHRDRPGPRARAASSATPTSLTFWWTSAGLDYYRGYVDSVKKVTRADIARYARQLRARQALRLRRDGVARDMTKPGPDQGPLRGAPRRRERSAAKKGGVAMKRCPRDPARRAPRRLRRLALPAGPATTPGAAARRARRAAAAARRAPRSRARRSTATSPSTWFHGMQVMVKRIPGAELASAHLYIRGGSATGARRDAGVEMLAPWPRPSRAAPGSLDQRRLRAQARRARDHHRLGSRAATTRCSRRRACGALGRGVPAARRRVPAARHAAGRDRAQAAAADLRA